MATVVLLLPLIGSLLLAALARPIGQESPPALAVVCLTVASVVAALSTGFALAILGLTAFVQLAPIGDWIGWSSSALDATEPLPGTLSAIAGIGALLLLALALRRGIHTVGQLWAASRLCNELGPGADGLVVIDDERADAFAVSGFRTGRIVVSRSMLRALSPSERRALLAHEAAHLRRRHHLYVQMTEIAAAANPMLRPAAREVRVGVERWADQIAAIEVGDRPLVAQALARAGLARMTPPSGVPNAALGATESDLQQRIGALLRERPRRRPLLAIITVALALSLVSASAVAAEDARARLVHADAVFDHR